MRIADALLPKQPWRSSATQRTCSQFGQSLSKETPTQINEGEEDRENRQREENESGLETRCVWGRFFIKQSKPVTRNHKRIGERQSASQLPVFTEKSQNYQSLLSNTLQQQLNPSLCPFFLLLWAAKPKIWLLTTCSQTDFGLSCSDLCVCVQAMFSFFTYVSHLRSRCRVNQEKTPASVTRHSHFL